MALPEGYKQIKYVESNGTGSYFKTGVIPTADTRVIFDGYVVSGDTALYGSRYQTNNNRYAIQYIGSNQYRLSYDSTEALAPASYTKGKRYTFDQRGNKLYIDGVLAASVAASPTYPNAREIYAVGALNTNNVASNLGVVRMYTMQIYQGGALVRDFIPVRAADGTIGIYDLITDVFYRNAGSGNVVGGDVLVTVTGIEITALPNKVEYSYGEELDLTGMVVTATYSDGTTGIVKGYEVSGYDTSLVGEQSITVRYEGVTAIFAVHVTEESFIVTFVDHDGTVLGTQRVKAGNAATAPDNPTRIGYLFTGWDQDFAHVTGDMTITAQYSTWMYSDGVLSIYPAFDMSVYEDPSGENDFYPWKDIRVDITRVVLVDGVSDIGIAAFGACTNLIDVVIPDSVTRIGMAAFTQCDSLTNIAIPKTVASIEPYAFMYCSNLVKIDFPDTLTDIGFGAFVACAGLVEVVLPAGLTDLAGGVFMDCTGLTDIVLPEKLTNIGGNVFSGCTSLTGITLPEGILSIGEAAFQGCTSLMEITIPASVASIGGAAFYSCTGLKNISILNREVKISDWSDTIYEVAVIHGYVGSTAQAYAEKHNRIFMALDPPYTVTFVDWDGVVLSEQLVAYGTAATAPEEPSRSGFFFLGWDKGFSVVLEDTVITALYDPVATISLSPSTLSLFEFQSADITAILLPETLSQKKVQWSSTVPEVAVYDPSIGAVSALAPGATVIKATHASQGVAAACDVTVVADPIDSIEIITLPDKTDYYVGEELETAGLTLKAVRASGREESVSDGYAVSGYSGMEPGVETITVFYSGKTAVFNVEVKSDTVISVKVTKLPDKTEYIVGQDFDPIGMVITATWISGKSEEVIGYTVAGFDSGSVGKKTVTIGFGGVNATFTIEIIKDTVIAIEITHLPEKTVYLMGMELDLTGMVVVATWMNGPASEISDYRISGYKPEEIGKQVVSVEVDGAAATFTVVVKGVTGIWLASPPTKTGYFIGEDFVSDGMQIIAHCTDGTEVDCTGDMIIDFTNRHIMKAPAASGHFREYSVEIPVFVDRAYIGEPTGTDVTLIYDFGLDLCTIDGTGSLQPFHELLGEYIEKLKEIRINGIDEVADARCTPFTSLESVIINAPIKSLPLAMFYGLKNLTHVELPDGLIKIDSSCFNGDASLTEIILPDTVESIGMSAFNECTGLKSVVFPRNLKDIGNGALYGCKDLQSIKFNDGLKTIGYGCFTGCDKLRVLLFPDSVIDISDSISQISLDYVRYPAGMTRITSGANSKTIVIPNGVTEITSGAFRRYTRIEQVFLPDTLRLISNDAFQRCGIKRISIPESVEAVQNGAFDDSGLEEIFFYGRYTVVNLNSYIPLTTIVHGYRGSSAEAYCKEKGNTFVPFDDYEFTEEIKNLYDTDSVRKRVVIHFPNGETADIENDRIYSESMSLTESICDEANLVFGGCNASKFEIQVADVAEDIQGAYIEVKQYIEDKYVPLFTGTIDSANRQDNRRFKKIIAYDRMYTGCSQDLTSWLKSLVFPMSILELRDKVCAKLGLFQATKALVNDYIVLDKLSIKDGITGREVLRSICEFNGVFGYITRMGNFDYISLEKSADTFPVTGYRKVKYGEYTVRGIEALNIRGSDGTTCLALGSGNKYVLRNNFIVYGMAKEALEEASTNLLAKIQGISYRQFSGDGRGLPYILLGQHVRYTINSTSATRETEVVESFVLKRTMTGIQALRDTYTAEGEEYQPDMPADTATREAARQLEDYASLDDLDTEFDIKFEEIMQSEQYQLNIEAAVQNALQNAGYLKIVSVLELPSDPAADTVYLVQGEVTVS